MDGAGPELGKWDNDPLRQLEEWGRQADRRQRRSHALSRLRHGLSAPVRALRGRRRAFVTLGVIVAIAAGLVVASGGLRALTRPRTDAGLAGGPTPVAAPTTPAGPVDPFAGTDAADWSEGAAGITLPAGKAVPGFTARGVTADLALVKKTMVAVRLDPRMLVRHDTSAFLSLLTPSSRGYFIDQFRTGNPLNFATLLDDDAHLSDHAPRVHGQTTFAAIRDAKSGLDVLEIVTRYDWIYAFTDDQIVTVSDRVVWWFYEPDAMGPADDGLWVHLFSSFLSNVDCEALQRHRIAPPQPGSVCTQPTPTGGGTIA